MDWRYFLEKCSLEVTASDDLLQEYNDSPNNWLGFEPATEQLITEAEERLNITLPLSYKEFLHASNGFKQISCFLWDIHPVNKIGWLKDVDAEFYNIALENFEGAAVSPEHQNNYSSNQSSVHFKMKHLLDSLVISGWGDAAFILLNPAVKFGSEWEAWVYANWFPGARRFKSFEDLMLNEYDSYVKLRKSS